MSTRRESAQSLYDQIKAAGYDKDRVDIIDSWLGHVRLAVLEEAAVIADNDGQHYTKDRCCVRIAAKLIRQVITEDHVEEVPF
ncbi:hypothetical protein [Methylobacter sp.]|uniref:hypothetical protein n=1 Tax=Methylobacter sp. TaxID=2051955 RepID=UPI00122563BA|nr:hypothetical protein [Methylobacter sp.]TAK59532.1 MAG: hypothetical protein EPO18_20435 [Methylobacter sp.]